MHSSNRHSHSGHAPGHAHSPRAHHGHSGGHHHGHGGGPASRYSARKMSKPVHFYCNAPEAKAVSVVGEFNHWDAAAHPMTRMHDGGWRSEILLHHGHHQYAFLVDGQLVLDPKAQGISRNEKGERVSLLAVS